jgi:tetratricopeptide (TPR) repeat protein
MPWDEGYFKFEERGEIGEQRLLARVRDESLLMEGARRIDEWTRLETKVPSPEAVPALAANADREMTPLELRSDEWEVLAEIDGERDVRQIAADLGRSAFDVAKIVYGLVSTGVLEVTERITRIPELELKGAVGAVETLLGGGRADEAQKLAAQLETSFPDRADLAVLSGRTLVAQNRMRAATESFSRAVGLDPMSLDAHYMLGFAAIRTGELERATKAWETFLRLAPNGEPRQLAAQALASLRALTLIVRRVMTN